LPAREKGGMETKIETYDGCHQDAQVVSYSVKGGGNTWPGGEQYQVEKQIGKTSQDLNANATMWSFMVTKKLSAKSVADSAHESSGDFTNVITQNDALLPTIIYSSLSRIASRRASNFLSNWSTNSDNRCGSGSAATN
jgi:hypothetical protein